MTTYSEVVATVYRELGIRLELNNTGGGCMVYEGRLESGHWVAVTEFEDFISPDEYRASYEAGDGRYTDEPTPLGYAVGIYENCTSCMADEGKEYPRKVWVGGHSEETWTFHYQPHRACDSAEQSSQPIAWHTSDTALMADMPEVIRRALQEWTQS